MVLFDADAWEDLRRKTRRAGLFHKSLSIRVGPEGAVVRRGWSGVVGPVLLAGLGGAFCWGGRQLITLVAGGAWVFGPSLIACWVIGAGLVGLSLWSLFSVPGLWWESRGEEVWIRFGWFPWAMRRLCVPRRSLEVELSLIEERDAWGVDRPTESVVWLRRAGREESEARIAVGEREQLMPLYEALTAFLGGRGEDGTVVAVPLEDGRVLRVSRSPLKVTSSASFATTRLVNLSRDLAVFRPTAPTRVMAGAFLFSGIGLNWWAMSMFRKEGDFIFSTALAFMGCALGLGGAVMGVTGGGQRITVDRRRRALTRRSGWGWRRIDWEIGWEQIAAVQVCSQFVRDTDSSRTNFQLNLVLAGPEGEQGERINMACHGNEERLREDAAALARFMGKPLVDHG